MSADQFAILISLLSLIIATVGLIGARNAREIATRSNMIASKANELSKHYNLIPRRLEARRLALDFVRYCCVFRTSYVMGDATSGTEVLDARDEFLNNYDALGPLGMSTVHDRISQITGQAVNLQRAIDRTKSADPKPLSSDYESLNDNLDALVDYYGRQRQELPALFEEYLVDA
jgi:hypothetical protein